MRSLRESLNLFIIFSLNKLSLEEISSLNSISLKFLPKIDFSLISKSLFFVFGDICLDLLVRQFPKVFHTVLPSWLVR